MTPERRAHLERIVAFHPATCTCAFCCYACDALGLSHAPESGDGPPTPAATVTVLRTPAECANRYGGTPEGWAETLEDLGHPVLHLTPDGPRVRRVDDDR